MGDRPGVVLYFDVLPALRFLNYEQKGRLYEAILVYGESGKIPDFSEDPMLGMAWCFVGPRIDRDGESYTEKQEQKKYAVYCREAKKNNMVPLTFEEWKLRTDDERKSLLSADDRKVSPDDRKTSSDTK